MLIVRNRTVIHMQEASFIVPESADVKWLMTGMLDNIISDWGSLKGEETALQATVYEA